MDPVSVAIIGGGPGGLMTAFLLQKRATFPFEVTLFEATGRLGGKIVTPAFASAPVTYEAGAAELYDYSQLGPDPLRELVHELGLTTRTMMGDAVVMDEHILRTAEDIRRGLGDHAWKALERFGALARSTISRGEYYESDWRADNEDPLLAASFASLLDETPDELARRYLEVAAHSDLATEPEKTSATYGLQNYLMNFPDYMRLYGIVGGLERLPIELASRIKGDVRMNRPVVAVERTTAGDYLVTSRQGDELVGETFDMVVVALPHNWIPFIRWRGEKLTKAMRAHAAHYAYPAHYLRVSVLFDRPFWRDRIADSYFMLDAFGGCCVYDESSRTDAGGYGVLGWLLAGEAALAMSNLDDRSLVDAVVRALPTALRCPREAVLEGRVHRWLGAVNGLPGGRPLKEPDARHVPEPDDHPWLFVVGDYLFDSTINGVLDSADTVVEWIREEVAFESDAAVTTSALTRAADPTTLEATPVVPLAAEDAGAAPSLAPQSE